MKKTTGYIVAAIILTACTTLTAVTAKDQLTAFSQTVAEALADKPVPEGETMVYPAVVIVSSECSFEEREEECEQRLASK